jgi:Arc/MetJ-type ribon-helix-helix transcriptional regulator
MRTGTVRTTVTLPVDLVDAADRAVREGRARSRNDLLVAALRRELADQERADIDAAFAAMADDQELQAESIKLAEESMQAGWEALQLAEADA